MSDSEKSGSLPESPIDALIHLEDVHGLAVCVADAVSEAVGDSPPSWLLVFQYHLREIGEAMDGLSRHVRGGNHGR